MLYPLKFDPIYKAKAWGGRSLAEHFGRTLPDGAIGESWELADLGATSKSGGGGDAARSVVANGPYAARTLHDLVGEHGAALVGDVPLTPTGDFPLLLKFLDAAENLSVQVHPSPAYAKAHRDAHLKSEAWYIVDAARDAVLYVGIHAGVTDAQFRAAIADNTVADLMITIPAKPGDCHYLPSGTCHALGGGILVAEVQTPSDTTFRVYDWGRPASAGRDLHVNQAMQCLRLGPVDNAGFQPRTRIARPHTVVEALVHCEHFRIERLTVAPPHVMPIVTNHQPRVYMIIAGTARLTCRHDDASAAYVRADAGDTLLLPAELHTPELHVEGDAPLVLLDITFPQATADLLA